MEEDSHKDEAGEAEQWDVDQDTPKMRAGRGGDMELDPVTSLLFPH